MSKPVTRDDLGDRMKRNYEAPLRQVLPWRMPVIVRVDGIAFHSYTRGLSRPFSEPLIDIMNEAAIAMCSHMGGAQMAFVQSDEISVLLHGYKRHGTQPWFGNCLEKIVTDAATTAASTVSMASGRLFDGKQKLCRFDGRARVYPEAEVNNYFVWREQDALRNSKQMLGQSLFSAKELHGMSCDRIVDMCMSKGVDWNALPPGQRQGRRIVRHTYDSGAAMRSFWAVDDTAPFFEHDPHYVQRFLAVEPEDD